MQSHTEMHRETLDTTMSAIRYAWSSGELEHVARVSTANTTASAATLEV